jgi:hypothetical protein
MADQTIVTPDHQDLVISRFVRAPRVARSGCITVAM